MPRDDCDCDQDTKVVYFVGQTQNGKSSLIQSIFRYAGAEEQADRVRIGDGNVSETKAVSSYQVKISLATHELRNAAGVSTSPEDDDKLETLEPHSEPSGQHVHLLLLDTPGLDDSAGNSPDSESNPLPGLSADSEHKLSVLKALNDTGSINGVCFVLKVTHPLGNTFGLLTEQYLRAFRECGLKPSLHFAHAHVSRRNMFTEGVQKRSDLVDDKLNSLSGRIAHHLINNSPNMDDPQELCLADMWLSDLLRSLSADESVTTTSARYPKPESMQSTEEQIRMALASALGDFNRDREQLEKQQRTLLTEIRTLENHVNRRTEEASDLRERINALDTCELELIEDPIEEYERSHLLSHAKISFYRSFEICIREFDIEDDFWTSSSKCGGGVGFKHLAIDARARYGEPAKITVTVWGYKKDINAKRIESLKEELKQTEISRNSFQESVKESRKKAESIKDQLAAVRERINQIEKDQATMSKGIASSNSLPLEKVLNARHLLTGSDSYRVSSFYSLSAKVPRSCLPSSWSLANIKNQNEKIANEHWETRKRYEVALEAFSAERQRRESLLRRIRDLKNLNPFAGAEHAPMGQGCPELPHQLTKYVGHSAEAIEPLRSKIWDGYNLISEQTGELNAGKSHCIEGQQKLVEDLLKDLEPLVKEYSAKEAKWVQLKERQTSIWRAADNVSKKLGKDELDIGMFAVLRSAWTGDSYDTGAMFQRLYNPQKYPGDGSV